MVVPLRQHRDGGVEGAHVPVEQVVLVAPRNSARVSATLAVSSVTMFFQMPPSGSFASAAIGPSA